MSDAEALARKIFREYYRRTEVEPPSRLLEREFGFVLFGSKGMIRHVSFKSAMEMNAFLRSRYPKHVYYSSAYYEKPNAERMDEKGWKGADLIFDIDVDHIYTPCKELHDRWVCRNCGAEGWGFVLKCPKCGSERISRKTWVCDTCIAVSRDELLKLIEFLEDDFGISEDEMYAVFSGHRGFHLHVEKEALREMGQDARREISDYVRGVGIVPELFLVKKGRRYTYKYDVDTPGWPGRIARYLLFKYSGESSALDSLEFPLNVWKKIFDEAVSDGKSEIDEKVTIDVKRLIRLPGSLHGKTGMKVMKIDIKELEQVDVLKKAVIAGDEEVVVRMEKPPKKVLWYTLDPGREEFRAPLHLALYLALNGGAQLVRVAR